MQFTVNNKTKIQRNIVHNFTNQPNLLILRIKFKLAETTHKNGTKHAIEHNRINKLFFLLYLIVYDLTIGAGDCWLLLPKNH